MRLTRSAVVLLMLLPLLVVALLYLWRVPTTFDVTASTEVVTFETGPSIHDAASWWPLQDVRIVQAGAESPTRFSGFFEPAAMTHVRVERLANGPVVITMEPATGAREEEASVGRFFTWGEEEVLEAGSDLEIWIPDMPARADSGETLVIPVAGQVTSRGVGAMSSGSNALLRSGTVRLMGRSIFGDRAFVAGTSELGPGDQFLVEGIRGTAVGLVVADERPALRMAYRVIGDRGIVERPAAGAYTLSVSLFDRALNEPLFQALFVILGGLAVIAGMLSSTVEVVTRLGSATVERQVPHVGTPASHRVSVNTRDDGPDPSAVKLQTAAGGTAEEPGIVVEDGSGGAERSVPAPGVEVGRGESLGAAGRLPAAVLGAIAGLLVSSSAMAQQSVFVRAGEEGQGLLRARGSECFVILPWHVVEDGSGSADIIALRGLRGSAELELSDEANDLAVMRIGQGNFACAPWADAVSVEAIRSADGYLRVVEETGTERRVPVTIRETDSRYITVRLRDPADAIMKSRSGAALIADSRVVGMLMSVCGAGDEHCAEGDGQVLRGDAVARLTDGFFDTDVVRTAEASADVLLQYERSLEEARRRDRARADTSMHEELAKRGITIAGELPNIRRDVSAIDMMISPGRAECHEMGCTWGRVVDLARPWTYASRTVYAKVTLTPAVPGSTGDLPERIGTCELRSGEQVLRRAVVPRGESDGRSYTGHHALLWGDTAAVLPAGTYSMHCVLDGLEFESGAVTLAVPVLPWGQFLLRNGGVAAVEDVRFIMDGRTVSGWEVAPEGTTHRVEVPASNRIRTSAELSFHVRQQAGPPLDDLNVAVACSAEGMDGAQPVRGEKQSDGRWRFTRHYTSSARMRAGEYHGRCALYNGVELFHFVLVVR